MRIAQATLALSVIVAVGASGSACSGDDADRVEPTVAVSQTSATDTAIPPSPTPGPDDTTATSSIEVQGVVGVVITATRIIEIRPTGDSDFRKIALTPNATIIRPNGDPISLEEVRPSDRIVAFGRPGDDGDTLISGDITVQQVIQSEAPGGG